MGNKNNNLNEIGEQFKDAVADALSTGDFQQLNGLVKDTVNSAIEEAKNQAFLGNEPWREDLQRTRSKFAPDEHDNRNMTNNYVKDHRGYQNQNNTSQSGSYTDYSTMRRGSNSASGRQAPHSKYDYRRRTGEQTNGTYQGGRGGQGGAAGQGGRGGYGGGQPGQPGQPAMASRRSLAESRKQSTVFRKVGGVAGTLLQVFGGIGIGGFAIAAFVMGLLLVGLKDMVFLYLTIAFLLASLAMISVVTSGSNMKSRLDRAIKYFDLFGKNKYMNISELEIHTGKSRKFLIKDIKKMIKSGIFPQGHLDMKEECLILDDETYQHYLSLEKQRAQLQLNESNKKQLLDQEQSGMSEDERQLNEMIAEGRDCIRKLREMNDEIKGEVISEKLFRLEDLLKEIFDRLSEHPEQMPKLHKMMSYYLPTTLKLVAAYQEFDQVSEQGDDIISAKAEIENTLDTINEAFVELLNNLFRDAAYDAATDAQVLKSMLAREGLTKEPELVYAGGEGHEETPQTKLTFNGFDGQD